MKLFYIAGPTASGKSDLAVDLANYLCTTFFVSSSRIAVFGADSRQVFKKLDLGTGKIEGRWQSSDLEIKKIYNNQDYEKYEVLSNSFERVSIYKNQKYVYKNINHYLIDYIELFSKFNLLDFLLDFSHLINSLKNNYDYIILVGGTGLYISSVIQNLDIAILTDAEKNFLEKTLTKYPTLEDKQDMYNEINFNYPKGLDLSLNKLNQSDFNNPQRLDSWLSRYFTFKSRIDFLKIKYPNFADIKGVWLDLPKNKLEFNIKKRIETRIEQGMLKEIAWVVDRFYLLESDSNNKTINPQIQKPDQTYLNKSNYNIKDLGLEYYFYNQFLYKNNFSIDRDYANNDYLDYLNSLEKATLKYAKRQVTWCKKYFKNPISSFEDLKNLL